MFLGHPALIGRRHFRQLFACKCDETFQLFFKELNIFTMLIFVLILTTFNRVLLFGLLVNTKIYLKRNTSKEPKIAGLSEDFFIEEDFEAVLTIFCSYDYGANASEAIEKMGTYVVRCAIWYHLCNLENVKNTHGGVLILVKFAKINTPPWVFFTFLKLYKWYQIVQRTTYEIYLKTLILAFY